MNRQWIFLWAVLGGMACVGVAMGGERTQSFPSQKGGALKVRAAGGTIEVKGWEKDEVMVRVSSLSEAQLKAVSFSQGGGRILVEFNWDEGTIDEIKFDIRVPSTFNVDLNTGGGDISLDGPVNGTLKGSTGGGTITLGDVAGSIRMETAGGDIRGGSINGDLACSTAGGDIRVKNISGTGEISTAGGSVIVESAAKSLGVSTAGGDIRIGTAKSDISLSTAGGNISVGSGQGNVSMSTAGGSISMANARGRVQANTSAGNVRLEKVEGSVNAQTAAGNVAVTLYPEGGGSSSLATSAGNVVLRIPDVARATIRARTRGPVFDFDEDEDEDEAFIRSDFPVTRSEGRRKNGEVEVILNGGGHRISLETTMGMIEIRKAK